ncbi:MAG: ABC transporter permease [Arachnia sp.]
MRWSDLIGASLASLRQRFFRTLLTVLGVIIGTTSVIVMVSLGVGLSSAFTGNVDNNLALRMVNVFEPPPKEAATDASVPTAMDDRMLAALEVMPGVEAVWPVYRVQVELQIGGYTSWMELEGLPLEAIEALNVPFEAGEMPQQGAPLSLILGNAVTDQFWDERTGEPADIDPMAQPMILTFQDGDMFEDMGAPGGVSMDEGDGGESQLPPPPPKKFVVPTAGVLSGEGQDYGPYSYMMAADQASLIKALEKAFPGKALPNQPATADGKATRGFIFTEFRVLTADTETAELLYTDLQEQGYTAYSEIEWIRESQGIAVLIQAVLGGIGFVSLLVAAIGIANTMMMSVYERTKEIGIMKVLGAALPDIRRLFLIESAAIGFFGGVLGLIFSLGISAAVNFFTESAGDAGFGGPISVIPVWLMLGAVLFATAIGTVAGLLPAHRAMRLSPLAAIRAQ